MKTLLGILLALVCLTITAIIFFAIIFRDKRPQVYFAAAKGDTNYIGQYLASGGDVNRAVICYPAGHRYAPLLDVAVENGRLDTIDFLLKSGAKPNQPDSTGDTPLMWVIGRIGNHVPLGMRVQILKMLLKAGADPNLKASSEYNYAPLLEAASLGESQMVSILLAAGADVNATNKIGQTALHLANNAEAARLLIAAGANRDARYTYVMPADRERSASVTNVETPVESAVRKRRFDVLAVLTNGPAGTNRTERNNGE